MAGGAWSLDDLKSVILRHWGYRVFRPLQEAAMRAVLDGRDSLVVLPTGGGKSLCYQAPAVLRGGTTVVVSPLIALMKDQVDSLQACGIPAIQIDSSQTAAERFAYLSDIREGSVRLVFVSPERLVLTNMWQLLRDIDVRTFAIDEAHCISHWGHDFRTEFRELSKLRELFPDASVHAYTATATERVRQDIITQLALRKPEVLVGNFDRHNLTYRVLPRQNELKQVLEVLERHPGEGGIIYCIAKREVDELAAALQKHGIKALPYHAGLSQEQRKAAQEAFIDEHCDVVVATVAFGMGIDRSNIRFVLHARMPKSIEHYQQETGRAGRDGLEAECVLLYSGSDLMSWKRIIEKSTQEAQADPAYLQSSLQHLDHMDRYARGAVCRHRALVAYFGQEYDRASCAACDICLGDTEPVPDAQIVAQKILSCVARVNQSFGIVHVASVLRGENVENVRKRGHDQLSTFGLLKDAGKAEVRDWIYQLIGQGVLLQVGEDYPVLKLNALSWEVMKAQRSVRLVQLRRGQKLEKAKAEGVSWEGVDRTLFEALRVLRKRLADELHKPPYVIFNDTTLRELARIRPSSLERMRMVTGIGDTKLQQFGQAFFEIVQEHSAARHLTRDQFNTPRTVETRMPTVSRPNVQQEIAAELFRKGASLEAVAKQTGRARSTVVEYLARLVKEEQLSSVSAWVSDAVYQRVVAAARQCGTSHMKPIFIALGEKVSYDEIRIVLAHLQAANDSGA
jgi:ATP-dependent DNA helicase RecQ